MLHNFHERISSIHLCGFYNFGTNYLHLPCADCICKLAYCPPPPPPAQSRHSLEELIKLHLFGSQKKEGRGCQTELNTPSPTKKKYENEKNSHFKRQIFPFVFNKKTKSVPITDSITVSSSFSTIPPLISPTPFYFFLFFLFYFYPLFYPLKITYCK